jgi:signal peptidase II
MKGSDALPLVQRLMIMLPVALLLLGFDQWSKGWAVANVAGKPPTTYWGIFTLVYAENMGAWGSMGAGWGPQTRWLVLGVLPALVLLGLAFYALTDVEVTRWEVTACALVVAGGAGNLIDRFRLGYVQDFLYVGYGPIGTNIFNVADAVVMLGLGVLLVKNLQTYRSGRDKAAETPEG